MGKFKALLEQQDYLILHGALGTELEYRGYDVSGKLWSAKYLIEQPDVIEKIHEDYVKAGSDIITTSTYQASIPGLREAGLSENEAETIIRLTVKLAKEARDKVWVVLSDEEKTKRPYPLISGDVGPYAGYLADGSEYTGVYDKDKAALKEFHRPRIALMLDEGVDLLALETVPNFQEIQALSELLADEFPEVEAYLSVTSQNGTDLSDGTPLAEVAKYVDDSQQIIALGVNCSSPAVYDAALVEFAKGTAKPFVTYPNSGEVYDGATQTWKEDADHSHTLLENTVHWHELGAKVVGGCCRTRPSDIESLAKAFRA